MSEVSKLVGWGRNTLIDPSLGSMNDIVMNSTDLSVEEGQESEAQIEGGSAESRKKDPDKYILVANRRIANQSEVEDVLGFTESVDNVQCYPDNGGLGVKLINPSRHVAVKMNTTDGLVAIYTYKTKGATDASGKLTDVKFGTLTGAYTFTAVLTSSEGYSNKNPKNEHWYIKNGATYILSEDTAPQSGMTYYVRTVTPEA